MRLLVSVRASTEPASFWRLLPASQALSHRDRQKRAPRDPIKSLSRSNTLKICKSVSDSFRLPTQTTAPPARALRGGPKNILLRPHDHSRAVPRGTRSTRVDLRVNLRVNLRAPAVASATPAAPSATPELSATEITLSKPLTFARRPRPPTSSQACNHPRSSTRRSDRSMSVPRSTRGRDFSARWRGARGRRARNK